MEEIIENKIAKANLTTLSLEDFYPKGERKHLDIKPWLFEEMILKEKDFREHLKNYDFSQYENCYVSVDCSADAIIPQWAYMLIGNTLQPFAKKVVFGSKEMLETVLFEESFSEVDFSQFEGQRVILRGCGHLPIPANAYLSFAARLRPFVKSLMFGEACSTVPIFKRKM